MALQVRQAPDWWPCRPPESIRCERTFPWAGGHAADWRYGRDLLSRFQVSIFSPNRLEILLEPQVAGCIFDPRFQWPFGDGREKMIALAADERQCVAAFLQQA